MTDHFALDLGALLLLLLSTSCFSSELDVQCLRDVQKSVIDPSGILRSSWNFEENGTAGFICKFTGVECWHPDENRVLTLRLSNIGLQGPFPKGLRNCTSLTGLDLSSNNFTGTIPSDIEQQVPMLTSLDLSYNGFSGAIPVLIYNISYLNTLNLQHNQLSGEIPRQFIGLARLEVFNVADNRLSGTIPSVIRNISASNFAGNQGLCGPPLDDCKAKSTAAGIIRDVFSNKIIIAVVAVVAIVIICVAVVFCGLYLSDLDTSTRAARWQRR